MGPGAQRSGRGPGGEAEGRPPRPQAYFTINVPAVRNQMARLEIISAPR
jgi:hypothetical protein